MLAGLLFAIREAEDRPDRLAATLPFAGATLIEHQARLLIAAGVSQIVVAVSRLTPDLAGAISRIGRRGVAVDAVRTAAEAADKLHPRSRVLVLADGLVTTDKIVREFAGEGGDALLVVDEEEAGPALERIGSSLAWAGTARLDQARVQDVASMPRDYDLQSALLRAASQAGAAHLPLPPSAAEGEHGVEHRAAALEERAKAVLAAALSGASGWFERWVAGPVGRATLPLLVTRQTPTVTAALGGGLAGAGGLMALHHDLRIVGLTLVLVAAITWTVGGALAELRDEAGLVRGQRIAALVFPAAALGMLAASLSRWSAQDTALAAAGALMLLGGLVERGSHSKGRRLWWSGAGASLLIVLVGTICGAPLAGMILAQLYAAATLFDMLGRDRP